MNDANTPEQGQTDPEKEYGVTEAAEMSGVTRAAIHCAIKENRLPARLVAGIWLIKATDMAQYSPRKYKNPPQRIRYNRPRRG